MIVAGYSEALLCNQFAAVCWYVEPGIDGKFFRSKHCKIIDQCNLSYLKNNVYIAHSVYVCAYFISSGSWFYDHIQFNSAEIDTVWFALKSGIMLK